MGAAETPKRIPRAPDPEVSIVIPVRNQWLFTAACLRSLAAAQCSAGFEVIVVDDRSTDETADRLGALEGLIYLRNEERRGFTDSFALGTEKASGS